MTERIAFILATTDFGPMILNRLDYLTEDDGKSYVGVGTELLRSGEHSRDDIMELFGLLQVRRECYGDGVVVIDGGANIGTHTVAWAKAMHGWGSVMAFEPQERIFYALCGNIALNNLFNARASRNALSRELGAIMVPEFDFQKPANFGGLSLLPGVGKPGQKPTSSRPVKTITIDSLALPRCDFIKLDIEGMEPLALEGAQKTILQHKPLIFAECWACGIDEIRKWLPGYRLIPAGLNVIGIHLADRITEKIQFVDGMVPPGVDPK